MLIEFEGNTAAELYREGLWKFKTSGRVEHTRNGPAITMPDLSVFTLHNPCARVLADPTRNANPFFHMMEFIWMMAGRRDVQWIAQFNPRMEQWANDGEIKAAYGHRWRSLNWGDQIKQVIDLLRDKPTTRQAVIQMWRVNPDLTGNYRDKACNTQLLFRNNAGALDCTVINRSNDFVWGALGANICHLTMFHECVARFSDIPLGKYTVVSNNLHMYTELEGYPKIPSAPFVVEDIYDRCDPSWMFNALETYEDFVADCENFCNGKYGDLKTKWIAYTASYTQAAWIAHKEGRQEDALDHCENIDQPDWRLACKEYLMRKYATLSSAT